MMIRGLYLLPIVVVVVAACVFQIVEATNDTSQAESVVSCLVTAKTTFQICCALKQQQCQVEWLIQCDGRERCQDVSICKQFRCQATCALPSAKKRNCVWKGKCFRNKSPPRDPTSSPTKNPSEATCKCTSFVKGVSKSLEKYCSIRLGKTKRVCAGFSRPCPNGSSVCSSGNTEVSTQPTNNPTNNPMVHCACSSFTDDTEASLESSYCRIPFGDGFICDQYQSPCLEGSSPCFHGASPTVNPTSNPTENPTTLAPTTLKPTQNPTMNPVTTKVPTGNPSSNPSKNPTSNPSNNPTTTNPTNSPSKNPTSNPTGNPTRNPSKNPSTNPTSNPVAN